MLNFKPLYIKINLQNENYYKFGQLPLQRYFAPKFLIPQVSKIICILLISKFYKLGICNLLNHLAPLLLI
jgi:hypothetical protein